MRDSSGKERIDVAQAIAGGTNIRKILDQFVNGAGMQVLLQTETACRKLSLTELKKAYEEYVKTKLAEKRKAQ